MNEFKAPPGCSSDPLPPNGDIKPDSSVQWVSQGIIIFIFIFIYFHYVYSFLGSINTLNFILHLVLVRF